MPALFTLFHMALGVQTSCAASRAIHRAFRASFSARLLATAAVQQDKSSKPLPTMDQRLLAEEPDLVRDSLKRRHAPKELLDSVDKIAQLTLERSKLVEVRDPIHKFIPSLSAPLSLPSW